MELRLRSNPAKTFHVPAEIGNLILNWPDSPFEQKPRTDPRPKFHQQLEWFVGYLQGSGRRSIESHCLSCNQKTLISDFSGDTKKALIFCCGSGAPVPKWVAEKYAKLSPTEPAPKKTARELNPQRTW